MVIEGKGMSVERLRGEGMGTLGWFDVMEWVVQVG